MNSSEPVHSVMVRPWNGCPDEAIRTSCFRTWQSEHTAISETFFPGLPLLLPNVVRGVARTIRQSLLLIVLVVVTTLGAVAQNIPSGTQPAADTTGAGVGRHDIATEKTIAETEKIRAETEQLRTPWRVWVSLAPFITVMVGVLGGVLSIGKYFRDRKEAQTKEIHEQFMTLVKMLGDKEVTTRVMGAISLSVMAGEEYDAVIRQSVLYSVLWRLHFVDVGQDAAKKREGEDEQEVLSHTLSSILPLFREPSRTWSGDAGTPQLFSRLPLSNADLSNVVFDGCRIASSTVARSGVGGTSFVGATLRTVRFEQVTGETPCFTNATFDDVTFDRINLLRGVSFHGATVEKNGLRFIRCTLDNCRFDGMTIVGELLFEDCILAGTTFSGVDTGRVRFRTNTSVDGIPCEGLLRDLQGS